MKNTYAFRGGVSDLLQASFKRIGIYTVLRYEGGEGSEKLKIIRLKIAWLKKVTIGKNNSIDLLCIV